MLWPPFALFALAAVAPGLARYTRGATGWILGLGVAATGAAFAARLPLATPLEQSIAWVPTLGLELGFRLDGLTATFALLITGIGALVLIHAGGYLRGDPRLGRLFALLLFFLGAMLGLVLSDNLIALFVFWELTSVASYLLVGFDHERLEARRSALTALVVTGAGGMAMLAGFVLLHLVGLEAGLAPPEAWRISALLEVNLRGHELYPAIVLLLLAGAATKSAQVPFHFWLPGAMAAPTPVSALLHSATMVKAGIYLLARLHPALGQTPLWEWTLGGLGAATMLFAAVMTQTQRDLKRILAYSTVAVLGILVMLLGVGTPLAIEAMVAFLVAHALYKAALFLIAGNVDHESGTRDVTQLGGLWRAMPFTAAAGVLAALSKAGAPPMFGFVGKELLYKTKLDLETVGAWLIVAAVLANVLLVASALLTGVKPFVGAPRSLPKAAHEAPWSMRLGPMLLAGLGLFVALLPGWFDRNLASPMASAIAGYPLEMRLKLWYGLSPSALAVLGLSLGTLGLGAVVFWRVRHQLDRTRELADRLGRFGPTQNFHAGLAALYRGAGALTDRIQTGQLRHDLRVLVWAAILALLVPATGAVAQEGLPAAGEIYAWEALIVGLTLAGAVLAATARGRLTAIAGLGVTGMAVAVIFVLFGAPDLAITQVMVETLTVILFVLVLRGAPPPQERTRLRERGRDLLVAGVLGGLVTLLVLAAATLSRPAALASWYAAASVPLAHGRNVVNVILVDFRALDTLGEITVVAVAALGVLALLRGARRGREGPS